ncbi:MAG: MarR family transcriptional regulator [Thermomicrobiales bacterium]|nr:MarR family transcriptional regulator [Thermomicrobiales bacterium]
MQPVPEIGEGKRGESGYLGYLMRQAVAANRQATERALEDLGVTQPQFLVMTLIHAYPGSSGADLARAAMLTPQTMSVIVANLEKAGRLHRANDPANARRQRLELTEEGLDLLNQSRERVRALDRELAADLTAEQEQFLRKWLVQVAQRHDRAT